MAEELVENASSRGEFLARGAGLAGLAVGAGVLAGSMATATSAEAASDTRSYVSGHFQLDVSGILIGLIKKFEGGSITADVTEEETEPGVLIAKKHLGNIKYEDFDLQLPFSTNKTLYSWINDAWSGEPVRRSGAVTLADHDYNAKRKIEFEDAILTGIKIPACDASSKEVGYLGVVFAPEFIEYLKASGKVKPAPKGQKMWVQSNFRLKLGDLPCNRVSKIDSFTVKQAVVTEGEDTRVPQKEPGKLEFPNLKVTFAEQDLPKWDAWFTSMVLKGNIEDEKDGTLELLGPNLQAALCTINLVGVGIYKLSYSNVAADSNAIKKVTAELYVERMEIKL